MNGNKRSPWTAPTRTTSQPAAAAPRNEPVKAEKVETEFKLTAKGARSVAVAGTFNSWQPNSPQLSLGSDGIWRARLSLAPGRYEYRFVVDGQWIEDPLAKESIANPYGGNNSVLTVETPSAKSAYAGAW